MPYKELELLNPPSGTHNFSEYYYHHFCNFLSSIEFLEYESGYYPLTDGTQNAKGDYTYWRIKGSSRKIRTRFANNGIFSFEVMKPDNSGYTNYWSLNIPTQSAYKYRVHYNANVFCLQDYNQMISILLDNQGEIIVEYTHESSISSVQIGLSAVGQSQTIIDGQYLSFPCYIKYNGEYHSDRYVPNLFQVLHGVYNSNQLLLMDGVQCKVHPKFSNMIMIM